MIVEIVAFRGGSITDDSLTIGKQYVVTDKVDRNGAVGIIDNNGLGSALFHGEWIEVLDAE